MCVAMESGGCRKVESVWWMNDERKGEWERDDVGVRWMNGEGDADCGGMGSGWRVHGERSRGSGEFTRGFM
jgi:hypothetical protein